MADTKVTGLDALTSVATSDILYIVDDPGGTPISKKVTVANLAAGVFSALTVTKQSMQVRVPLYDNVLAADGTWDISSISQDYDHLELFIWAMSTRAAVSDAMKFYLNNDTTDANYYTEISSAADTTQTVTEQDATYIGTNPGTTAPANSVGVTHALILNYANAAKLKQILADSSYRTATGTLVRDIRGIQWESTNAINRIAILGNVATNILAGSRLQIIGIKTMDVVVNVAVT